MLLYYKAEFSFFHSKNADAFYQNAAFGRRSFGRHGVAKKVYNISLLLGWNERYDHRVAVGIIKFAHRRRNWRLSGNEWLFRKKRPAGEKVDGIIARITNREEHERIASFGVPVVDIANAYHDAGIIRVLNDDVAAGALAAAHFREKGYPHAAFVGIDETSWSNERKKGFGDEWAGRSGSGGSGSGGEAHFFNAGISWLRREPGLSGLAKWLAKLPLPCGVLAANDILGYRTTIAAAMAGLPVPERLGVIGVDNDDVFCELSQPRLTSVLPDCEKIGMEAASHLARALAGRQAPGSVVIPALGIVERESTNIVFGRDDAVIRAKRFILGNVGKGINVSDVVSYCNLSRRALERRFLKSEGRSLHDAIHRARLELAAARLASGKSVADSGFGSGYRTVQHFYYAFKRHYGVTPLEYSKREGGVN